MKSSPSSKYVGLLCLRLNNQVGPVACREDTLRALALGLSVLGGVGQDLGVLLGPHQPLG